MNKTELSTQDATAVNMLFEAAKLMIPVVTGFLVLSGGILGQLWENHSPMLKEHRFLAATPIILGVLSLGVWSGTVPYCITAVQLGSQRRLNLGQRCARAAHVLFFFAVAAAMYFCLHYAFR
jgi:hypothetical protein